MSSPDPSVPLFNTAEATSCGKQSIAQFALSRRLLLKAGAIAGLAGLARAAFAAQEEVGAVSEVVGRAFSEVSEKQRKLEPKSPVFLGDTLGTGVKSRLAAVLARKTSLRLGAETRVTIDKFVVERGGVLALGSGALLIEGPGKALSAGITVQSPFALIAVRGTRFFAGKLGEAFSVFVARGSVDVTAGGKTVRLRRGEGTDIAQPGGPLGPVKKWGKAKIDKAMALVE